MLERITMLKFMFEFDSNTILEQNKPPIVGL